MAEYPINLIRFAVLIVIQITFLIRLFREIFVYKVRCTGNVDITLRDHNWREIGKLVITEIDIVTNEKGQQSAIVKGNVEGGQTFETAVEFSPVDEQYWPEDSSGYYTLLDFDAGGNTLTINISFKSDGTLSVHDDVDTYLGTLTQA